MGEVLRGAAVLLGILVLSGSVAPSITVSASERAAGTLSESVPTERPGGATPSPPPGQQSQRAPVVGPAESVASERRLRGADTIRLTQRFERLPDRPGMVRVTLRYTVPDRVVSLRTTMPVGATLSDRTGFDRINQTYFRWTETTQRPAITYDLPVNETVERTDPQAATGRYLYADTANWSLFERPSTATTWLRTGTEPIELDRSSSTVGPGAAGQWMVFLGDHEIHERRAHGQRFRLVVPAAASLGESPAAILDAMANGSDALRVGDRDRRVFMVAAPTGGVRWGVRGLQTGDTDFWVRDGERLDEADSAWIHEYVHSRQSFRLTSRTRWFEEASASYYAALLSLEQDAIDFSTFRDRLRAGTVPAADRAVLSNVSTWQASTDYHRGALVAGQLDRRLRVMTDRTRTLQDIFRTMNGQRRPITQFDFLEALAQAGGTDVLDVGQTYTETPASLTTWNRSTHAAVFGQLPARVGYELPPVERSDAYRITGPYRNRTVGDGEPITLVTGERLTVDAIVDNAGGTTGTYNLSLLVNGTAVDETSGRIGPSQSTTAALSHRFPTTGTYVVGIDGEAINVTVQRPASARVVGLSVDRTQPRQGEAVTLTATVHNDAAIPGRTTVVFTRNFEEVARAQVALPANSTTFVTQRIGLPTAGAVSLGAGGVRSVEVSVEAAPVRTTAVDTTEGDPETATETSRSTAATAGNATGAGFGPVAALLAVATIGLAVARRYRH